MDKFDEIKPYLIMIAAVSKQYDHCEDEVRCNELNNLIRTTANQMILKSELGLPEEYNIN